MGLVISAGFLVVVLSIIQLRLKWIQPPEAVGSFISEGSLISMQHRLNRKGTMSLEPETL